MVDDTLDDPVDTNREFDRLPRGVDCLSMGSCRALNELYRRQKASDMLESIADTWIFLQKEFELFKQLYPAIYTGLYQRGTFENHLANYWQFEHQLRGYITELRQKGV